MATGDNPRAFGIAPNVGGICGAESSGGLSGAAHLPGPGTELTLRHLMRNLCSLRRRQNSKWALMLNIFLSGEFNFDHLLAMSGADVKVRARFRNSMQIGMLCKAISEGKRECRIVQCRH